METKAYRFLTREELFLVNGGYMHPPDINDAFSSSGKTSSGNTSSGKTSSGNTSSGNTSSSNTSSSNTSSSKTSSSKTSSSKTSSGNAPSSTPRKPPPFLIDGKHTIEDIKVESEKNKKNDRDSGNTSSGNISSGNTSSGNTSSGNTSSGNTSSGNTSSGNTSSGNTSSGNISSGNTSSGNTSSSNTSSSNTSSSNTSSSKTSSSKTSSGNAPSSTPRKPPPVLIDGKYTIEDIKVEEKEYLPKIVDLSNCSKPNTDLLVKYTEQNVDDFYAKKPGTFVPSGIGFKTGEYGKPEKSYKDALRGGTYRGYHSGSGRKAPEEGAARKISEIEKQKFANKYDIDTNTIFKKADGTVLVVPTDKEWIQKNITVNVYRNSENSYYNDTLTIEACGEILFKSTQAQSEATLSNTVSKHKGGTLPPGVYDAKLINTSKSYKNVITLVGDYDYHIHPNHRIDENGNKVGENYVTPASAGCQILKEEEYAKFMGVVKAIGFEFNNTDTISVRIFSDPNKPTLDFIPQNAPERF